MLTVATDCLDGRTTCKVCGFSSSCRGVVRHRCHGRGLGDLVAAGLSSVGVTPERVSHAIGTDCGCHGRKSWLNRLGAWLGLPPGSG